MGYSWYFHCPRNWVFKLIAETVSKEFFSEGVPPETDISISSSCFSLSLWYFSSLNSTTFKRDTQILAFLLHFTGLPYTVLVGVPWTNPFPGPKTRPVTPTSMYAFITRTCFDGQLVPWKTESCRPSGSSWVITAGIRQEFWFSHQWMLCVCVCVCVCVCARACVYIYFPGGPSGKEPTCQWRRHKRCGFSPWVRKILWRRAWQPTPEFLPRESHGQRSLVGYSP